MKRGQTPLVHVVGVNHRTATIEQRERLAFSPQEVPDAFDRLRRETGGGLILSTCNRTEVYVTASAGQGEALVGLLLSLKGLEGSIHPGRFYLLRHDEAVRHLYRVASGIDSLVVGEAQILGQVREALAAANRARSLNGALSRLFHTAIAVGKRARSETNIGRYARSVSSTAVALAKQTFGQLDQRTVLIISAGSTGKLAARSLANSGAARILVTNRTYSRARELARRLNGQAIPFHKLPDALAEADMVISATGADGFVLSRDEVAAAIANRNGRDLLLIDIAVPRDIEPAVRAIPGVHLFDIDDLQAVAETDGEGYQRDVARVEAIVDEEVARFLAWWRSLDAVPVVAALRQRAEAIRRRELDKALRRLPDLDSQERQRIEAMTAAIVKKMLHDPISRLKGSADTRRHLEAIQDLFDLPSEK